MGVGGWPCRTDNSMPRFSASKARIVQKLERVLLLRVMVHARDAQLGRCCASLRSMQQVLDPFRSILIVLLVGFLLGCCGLQRWADRLGALWLMF